MVEFGKIIYGEFFHEEGREVMVKAKDGGVDQPVNAPAAELSLSH